MELTLSGFKALNREEQSCLALMDGSCIGNRTEGSYQIFVYQLYSFYVEIYYNVGVVQAKKIKAFASTDHLKPYLHQIDISKILGDL